MAYVLGSFLGAIGVFGFFVPEVATIFAAVAVVLGYGMCFPSFFAAERHFQRERHARKVGGAGTEPK
ncbi:MAG: hypothetical protein LC808_37145 [Actinobacteria bacterium]|nr:hypothetical protein [Actinomycetota bacterium]